MGNHGVYLNVLEALPLVWYIVRTLGVESMVEEMGRILKNLVVSLVSIVRASLVVGAWVGNPWCDQCSSYRVRHHIIELDIVNSSRILNFKCKFI